MTASAREPAGPGKQPFLHLPVPWVFVLGYLLGAALQVLIPAQLSSSSASTALRTAGGILFVAGAGLAAWSWVIFKRAGTSAVLGETSRVLVTRGPYRLTRNPMYAGLTLAYLGEEGALVQVWPLLFLLFVLAYVNWFVIPVEEANLTDFEEYGEYRSRVHRWL